MDMKICDFKSVAPTCPTWVSPQLAAYNYRAGVGQGCKTKPAESTGCRMNNGDVSWGSLLRDQTLLLFCLSGVKIWHDQGSRCDEKEYEMGLGKLMPD